MELIYYPAPHCVRCPAKLALSTLSTAGLGHSQSPSRRDLGRCSPSPVMVMAAMQHFSLPSPLCSPLLPPWLSLICQLVVVSMPPPLVLSTLPPPQPLPINNPAASCQVVPLFPFTSVCCPVVVTPLVAPPLPCITFRCTAASCVYPQPPLFVCNSWLLHRISPHRLCLSISMRDRLTCCLLRQLCLTSASMHSLAPPFLLPPLPMPRLSPASSNAWCTLPTVVSPTATTPSCLALVL